MKLDTQWNNPRWNGITRTYTIDDVKKLRGSLPIEYSLANHGSERLWDLLSGSEGDRYIHVLSAITGNQAIQEIAAGLKAIYVSGWQVAADGNEYAAMYPDQSLYPANSVPTLVRRINNALRRADQIDHADGLVRPNTWYAPIVADAEAGFGGNLNAFELTKALIEAGAAGIHFEDQLSSEKKCGHLGGKVLVPTAEFIKKLIAARLAADICGVPTVLIARTDAHSAKLITNDYDDRDKVFLTGNKTEDGFFSIRDGVEPAIHRGLAYAPYADLIWWETSSPDLGEAREFAEEVHKHYPGKTLAYNCSPSFNWRKKIQDEKEIETFQSQLAEMGYKFQFVTLSGFHSLNLSIFKLAYEYKTKGMSAYATMQDEEFANEVNGYGAAKHQKFVGTGYFDKVSEIVSQGKTSTTAMKGSTEEEQF